MKTVLLLAVLALLLPSLPAMAGDGGRSWNVLIVDKDVNGTNVRNSPGGQVIKVIPSQKGDRPRLVTITGQSQKWFNAEIGGVVGWIHGSVLGTCAEPTEDGDPSLAQRPSNDSPPVARIPAGAPVLLLGMQGGWLKVQFLDAHRDIIVGWLPEQSVAMGEGSLEDCARAWARK
jgi:hypothetical protein